MFELFDLLLRGQTELSARFAEEEDLTPVIRRLLAISVFGLVVHGLAVGTAAQYLADPQGAFKMLSGGYPSWWVPAAFVLAFLGALSICLPSFYFYAQLSGLDASLRLCTAQALRAQATTSVFLLGALPIYLAIALAAQLGLGIDGDFAVAAGVALPFLVGLFGVRAVYRGFNDLLARIPITHERRGNFVRRMVLMWGGLYTAVAPIALFRLAERFSALGL
jgi:hypothetical protein